MTATGDDRSSVRGSEREQRTMVDVTGSRLVDLVDSRDPGLAASVRELAALLDKSTQVRLGWQSAITEE